MLVLAYHNHQAVLYPTRIRSKAVGFVYSWSRIAASLAGLAVGYPRVEAGHINLTASSFSISPRDRVTF